jgi:hypothetical protein
MAKGDGRASWEKRGSSRSKAVATPDPVVAKKTGEHAQKKYAPKAKAYAAGSNALDREKRGKYKDSFKTRADDPRNWEFHYNEKKSIGRGRTGGKGEPRRQGTESKHAGARRYAERQAKRTGQDIYDIREIQYDTASTKGQTKQMGKDSKAMGRAGGFGSTRVAQGVEAAKQKSNRRTSRAASRTTNAFAEKT